MPAIQFDVDLAHRFMCHATSPSVRQRKYIWSTIPLKSIDGRTYKYHIYHREIVSIDGKAAIDIDNQTLCFHSEPVEINLTLEE